MSERRFLAPGKVVLLGEYAVLDGAPAVVAAVDSGVLCTVTPATTLTIRTPGDDHYARAALEAASAPAARYSFRDANPPGTSSKAGLGGSAAATVAAYLAGSVMRGHPPTADALFAASFAVHHAVQGSGSGIDVAASAYGGVLLFEHGQAHPTSLDLPLVVVFSGSSASTGPRVKRYLAWGAREPFVQRSRALTDAFAEAPLATLREARQVLQDMAEQAGVAYRTPALDDLCDLAETHGGAAKPSGAGGGDCAVALFANDEAASAYRRACRDGGYTVLATRIASGAAEQR